MALLLCHKCREFRPAEEFPVKLSTKRGRRGICLTCEPAAEKKSEPKIPEVHRHAMCGKKHRYRTEASALGAALKSARRTRLMRVYRCPLCHGWHLTHKEAKTRP